MGQPKFGIAGAGDLFYSKGYKNSYEVPEFLENIGLQAFEYQCGRGVRIGAEKAKQLGEEAVKHNIALSIHAPYYISLTTTEEEKNSNNLRYFRESAQAARSMGATRVVFHPGGVGKQSREEAFTMAATGLIQIMAQLEQEGFGDIIFCPETMGKVKQLGDLNETLAFCKAKDNMIPCIDFGHMNSRYQGHVNSGEAYQKIFDQITDVLGEDKVRGVHCHFSKIEYGTAGEKKHLTFTDDQYGPDYEPLMELLYKKSYTPTIICESAGTQAEDAKAMEEYYKKMES